MNNYDSAISNLAHGIAETFETSQMLHGRRQVSKQNIFDVVERYLGPSIKDQLTRLGENTAAEQDILQKVRTIGYGEVTVKVKDGRPVLVTESKTTRLD